TGFYDYGARLYDPKTGRFLSADTSTADGYNRYAYAGNNPLRYNDPSGHQQTESQENVQRSLDDFKESWTKAIFDGWLGTWFGYGKVAAPPVASVALELAGSDDRGKTAGQVMYGAAIGALLAKGLPKPIRDLFTAGKLGKLGETPAGLVVLTD